MQKRNMPIKIGFDLDGVLLYNPARIIRPCIALFKQIIMKKKGLTFYFPKSLAEQLLWRLFHKSSLFNASGLSDLRNLVKEGKIEAHLITARYRFLGKSVHRWVQKNKLEHIFTSVYFNETNQQPHLFKKGIIEKLGLDYYVEDNYDIVHYLNKTVQTHIVWVYNLFDRTIPYSLKVPTLQKAIRLITELSKQ